MTLLNNIDQGELLNSKNKKVCTSINDIEHFLSLFFTDTACISISGFASLIDISKGIMVSAIWLNICAWISRIKKNKSIIKKNKKKHDEIN